MDRHAFSVAFEEAFPSLWLIAAGLCGDRAQADDIVQEAAIVAWEKLDQFRVGSNFAAWMAKIVRLTALNYRKKEHRRKTLATDPETLDREFHSPVASPSSATGESSEWQELSDSQEYFDDGLMTALNGLRAEARACLLLRTVAELSYVDIAQLLDIPEGTAMSHVHRAKRQLRDALRNTYCGNRAAR